MAKQPQGHIFTRLPSPDPKFSGVIGDIYDKLAATGTNSSNNTQAITIINNILNSSSSGSGGSGGGGFPSGLIVPKVDALPATATDGAVVVYQAILWRWNGTLLMWIQISTILIQDTFSNLQYYPAVLYNPGVMYYAIDRKIFLVVSISAVWIPILAMTQVDTHANRIANYKSVDYPSGTPFYESDRTVTYLSKDVVGTVDTTTAGNSVIWDSGPFFDSAWVGYPIIINNATYYFATVPSGTTATLTTDPGNQTAVASSVPSGKWVYDDGEMIGTLAQLPGALGVNDLNFVFGCTDEGEHSFRWNGSGWQFAPGDPGSGWVTFGGPSSPEPSANWEKVTSGGSGTYTLPSGLTTTFNFPTFDNGVDGLAFLRVGGTFNGTPTAASKPTWVGGLQLTEAESADVVVQSGTGATVAAANHVHQVDNVVTQIAAPNDTNGGLLSNITFTMWIRK